MISDDREKTDPDYRPWSWIFGFLLAGGIIALMFGLALSVHGTG